ncbi:flagellar hook assembly protein FlgD [Salinispirillum marinum]|uniref:Basal-body rod modification protein FlgD n=2 Tax=Saccharospirillaceae TaxID=255527 RepID=A0ABV8BFV8_9GAMM
MSNINQVGPGSALEQYGIDKKAPAKADNGELGKDQFLELMIAQLTNQNPLEPKENGEFIAQLAQFSTVEGITNMSGGFDQLATAMKSSQALQASSLVGGSVTVDGQQESTLRYGELVFGTANVASGADNLMLQIEDSSGQIIESVELGPQSNGELTFKWNGIDLEVNGEMADIDYDKFETDEDGNILPHPEGEYTFRVMGNVLGQNMAQDLSMSSRVDSVSIQADNTVVLNLDSGRETTLDKVTRINSVF